MRYLKRAIHLDFHTMPKVPDVGRDFNAKEFAKTLKDAHVDFINVFAKCNLGFAYYPTKIGIVHPSLKKDLLGQMVEECHKQGIGVVAYFNAGIDHEHAIRHREWCVLNKNGQVYIRDKMDHFFRMMCYNTGYGDYLVSMIKEVLKLYPVDGIFLDCMNLFPCYGNECLGKMRKQSMDILNDEEIAKFAHQTLVDFASQIRKIVPKGKFLYFNGIPYGEQIKYASHIEIESLPTGGWGYDGFPSTVRYVRNLDKQALRMTGRFHESWGDFGGIKPLASLEFDCFQAISNGAGCSIGDHMHPRGRLEDEVYDLIAKVYKSIEGLEPWTDKAKALCEIAIVMPEIYRHLSPEPVSSNKSVMGATRILSELNYQFDIIDERMNFSPYKILILPDEILISSTLKVKLERYIKKGGFIISSAFSGLNQEKTDFVIKEWNVKYLGLEEYNISFFKASRDINKDLPDMPTSIYNPGISIRPKRGTKVLAKLISPYFNKHWDGLHEYFYTPPDKDSGRPALVQSGKVIHFSFPIFCGYYEHAVLAYKRLLRNCIERILPEPLIIVENIPSFGRVTVTAKKKMKIIHLLVYCPELRGKQEVIEEPISVRDVMIKVRSDGDNISSVYLAPSKERLDFIQHGNYTIVRIPEVNGYQMVVLETKS